MDNMTHDQIVAEIYKINSKIEKSETKLKTNPVGQQRTQDQLKELRKRRDTLLKILERKQAGRTGK